MPYVITGACIDSKEESCVEVCPVDCIYDVGAMLAVHPDECIDCGACQPECPVEAIMPDTEVEPAQSAFIEINAAVRAGPRAAAVALDGVLARAADGAHGQG